jgi:hypothetical protein
VIAGRRITSHGSVGRPRRDGGAARAELFDNTITALGKHHLRRTKHPTAITNVDSITRVCTSMRRNDHRNDA